MAERGSLSDSQAKDLIERRIDLHGQSVERRPIDRMILRNRAMFFGKQHFLQDERSGRLLDPHRVSPLRVFYKANLMLGDIVRAMLTVTKARGEFVVPPKNGTKAARHAAWTSTKLFEHVSYANRMSEKDRLATSFAAIDGSGIWKVSWDTKKGEPRRFYWAGDSRESGVKVDLTESERAAKEEKGHFDDLFSGDVSLEVLSLLEVEWDWQARHLGFESANWACTKSMMTLDQIAELYGVEASKAVRPEDPTEGALYYNEAISFMASAYASPVSNAWANREKQGDRAMVCEYFERRGPQNNMKGRRIIYAGGVILKNGHNPYAVTKYEIPLVKQDWITAPGRFVGVGLAEQLANPQTQYNASRANVIEHQKVFGHPAIFVDPQSGIPAGQFSIQPGMVYEKKMGTGKVEFGPVPPTPEAALENAQMSRQEMAEISSQQSIDGSKMPGQLRSGDALETIFNERNKGMVEPAENFLGAKELVGRQALELMQRFGSDEQTIQYVGEDRKFRVLSFKRADVHADLRVIVDPNKILASPTAAKARIMEGVQVGALDPMDPDIKEGILKALEFNTADELISDRLQEEENQEREIEEIISDPTRWIEERTDMMAPAAKAGHPFNGYPVNPWDDHRIHARGCVRFMRSDEFRVLDPMSQSLIINHWQAHDSIVQQQQMQQMMMAEMARGGAAEKGTPSPPKMAQASQ